MANEDFNFQDEYIDDEEREQRRTNYNKTYLSNIENLTKDMDEGEKEELFSELEERHNLIRSGNPLADAEHNVLSARNAIHDRFSKDPATQSYLDYLDKREGKGTGLKKLKKAQQKENDSYFDHIERRPR